jgi:hypothetical protein
MIVSEEPVCIDLLQQNQIFTSLHLRSLVHVVPPPIKIFRYLLHLFAVLVQDPDEDPQVEGHVLVVA